MEVLAISYYGLQCNCLKRFMPQIRNVLIPSLEIFKASSAEFAFAFYFLCLRNRLNKRDPDSLRCNCLGRRDHTVRSFRLHLTAVS